MIRHSKRIEISDTGMVIASVYASDGRRTGLRFFDSSLLDFFDRSPERLKRRAIQAHQWADDVVLICDHYETDAAMSREAQ